MLEEHLRQGLGSEGKEFDHENWTGPVEVERAGCFDLVMCILAKARGLAKSSVEQMGKGFAQDEGKTTLK